MKDLNDLYIFALIVEHGGLSKVEQKTGISNSIEISVSYFLNKIISNQNANFITKQ
ncbi:TPA: hypothetical protein ACNHZ0_003465 [Acinetobacter baumannii]|uniref:hypothetical protein n=1 Tax=Acinetobacter baumannii TaxID=470 RepID=UPI001CDD566E|nr:hypothetical protein [Acinetobacter baumannii]MCA4180671.1 hypothetical protein [Acinetobacter baumannii]MCV4243082.1 hypothetical protein [Acinetobacter baumannii]MCZ3018850.1 hypothetical protein [Acinetobacter baumannii]MDA4862664.1 hypothetical protein [Acinetobacter baumannii]